MRFFWKIFLSTMLITMTLFSLGISYFIHSGFQYSLEQEISSSYSENDLLLKALSNDLNNTTDRVQQLFQSDDRIKKDQIIQTANSVGINTSYGVIPFRISDARFASIYESRWHLTGNSLIQKLGTGHRGYEIIQQNASYYIHTASPVTILGETVYVENYRVITELFHNRDRQYQTGLYMLLVILFAGASITFVITGYLTSPITRLSAASKQFANGDFSQRVELKSHDELGMLSRDFNDMAARIDSTVEELKASALRQESFVNNFAHELKTPLTSIIGYADMLRSKVLDQELVFESAGIIFQEGKRLESLSMKLMELIILKKQDFPLQEISTETFFNSVSNSIRPMLQNLGITFTCDFEDADLYIEPDLMKTVLMNLLDNARKAVSDHGQIQLTGKRTDDGYLIKVEDNGRGMEKKELARITEAFYMIDKSRAREQGGAGLGLSICAEILRIHHADLAFSSTPGTGTAAMITLKGGEL